MSNQLTVMRLSIRPKVTILAVWETVFGLKKSGISPDKHASESADAIETD